MFFNRSLSILFSKLPWFKVFPGFLKFSTAKYAEERWICSPKSLKFRKIHQIFLSIYCFGSEIINSLRNSFMVYLKTKKVFFFVTSQRPLLDFCHLTNFFPTS